MMYKLKTLVKMRDNFDIVS